MEALENQLKEARFLAEEADRKYDEVILSSLSNRMVLFFGERFGSVQVIVSNPCFFRIFSSLKIFFPLVILSFTITN